MLARLKGIRIVNDWIYRIKGKLLSRGKQADIKGKLKIYFGVKIFSCVSFLFLTLELGFFRYVGKGLSNSILS